jgi:glutamate formiminotransferase/formiminotetrahydrofolate cyclodeaminase
MNLTNYHKTPVARVVELIRGEAARYGVSIHHSELVGLIPQEALEDAAVWHLQLDQFLPDQVLEKRLYAALQNDLSPTAEQAADFPVDIQFLEALSAATPTPGGGSAAAYAANMAAALVLMVTRLTIGKPKYADVEAEMRSIEKQAALLASELTRAVSEDAAAYQAVMQAFRMPKDSQVEKTKRLQSIQEATLLAAQVPLEVARKSLDLLTLVQKLVLHGNINAISDAGSAAALAGAALSAAGLNVRINAPGLKDQAIAADLIKGIGEVENHGRDLQEQIRAQLFQRGGFSPG